MSTGAAAKSIHICSSLFFFKEGNPGVPNISIFRFKRSGLMRKACFLSTSNRPARAARFLLVFVQINYARKPKTGQPFLSCPVLFSGLMQQPFVLP